MFWALKNGVKILQSAGFNGPITVFNLAENSIATMSLLLSLSFTQAFVAIC